MYPLLVLYLSSSVPLGNIVHILVKTASRSAGVGVLALRRQCSSAKIVKKVPDNTKRESRVKRLSRWGNNDRIEFRCYYLL